ncbi:MAG: DUF6142 family protein [Lachnospiraceae bacterium]
MGKNHGKRRAYKFTEKKHSKKGGIAILLGMISLITMIIVINLSFSVRGKGTVYLGSVGLLSMFLGVSSLLTAIFGFRDENIFKILPGIGTTLGLLSTAAWIGIYTLGFL